MNRVRFKAHWRVEVVGTEQVFLLAETETRTLVGRAYALIAPLLTGQYSAAEIAALLAGELPSGQVHYTLNRLRQGGYLVDTPLSASDETNSAVWEAQGLVEEAITSPGVRLHGLGNLGVSADTIARILASLGLVVTDDNPLVDIVLTDDFLQPELKRLNERFLHARQPWLLVKPVGLLPWIGPMFLSEGACWDCLAQRLRLNRPLEQYIAQAVGKALPLTPPQPVWGPGLQAVLALAAGEIERYARGAVPQTADHIAVLNPASLTLERHRVVKRPQCPICGRMLVDDLPVRLTSQPKITDADGGWRSASAAETLKRYQHHVSPISGAVSMLQPVANLGPVHIYAAGLNRSRPLGDWASMRRSLRSHNAGKGVDALQAQVSGLCESLERYSGLYDGSERLRRATWEDLQGEAPHPNNYLQFSEAQMNTREEWNQTCPPHLEIPTRFDESRSIAWAFSWSLTHQTRRYLPAAYSYYDYPVPVDESFCIPDSNGNAAGSSLEDAILQGFLELVERDAVAIWWENRIRRPGVDIGRWNDTYIAPLNDFYARMNRTFWLLDLTTDLEIPVFAALSRRIDKPAEDIIMGFGAHLDARVAARRALTELNQMLPSIMGVTDANREAYFSEAPWELKWWKEASVAKERYLAPNDQSPVLLDDYPVRETDDLRQDVEFCVERAREVGIEVIVLNQTRPDIGLPVVKVVAPGLRHFWRRHAPGRLYDVPVRMGWLSEPHAESALNPWPMTL